MKKIVKINESQLSQIIAESVKQVIKERYSTDFYSNNPEGPHSQEEMEYEIIASISNLLTAYRLQINGLADNYPKITKSAWDGIRDSLIKVREESKQNGINIDISKCFNLAVQENKQVFDDEFSEAIVWAKDRLYMLGERNIK